LRTARTAANFGLNWNPTISPPARADLLMRNRVLPGSMSYNERWNHAEVHCQRYVGVVAKEVQWSDGLNRFLKNAENLLIYEVNKIIPLYNSKLKKKYLYDRPFTVINDREKPNGLKDRYSI